MRRKEVASSAAVALAAVLLRFARSRCSGSCFCQREKPVSEHFTTTGRICGTVSSCFSIREETRWSNIINSPHALDQSPSLEKATEAEGGRRERASLAARGKMAECSRWRW
ncbi:unnamed protein product [Tetraodon nigroviridis]|uniref:Chromosome 8 SCAF15119, whole genome shotgun sequence n=1 Tax=Tetraodon nigroviridis TaxID=99883 RepID=Q4RFC7_TETNG|nr:unnamed protein product [Tetraodon nigroviridis]